MSIFYKDSIDIYEIKETVELTQKGIVNGVIMNFKHSINAVRLDCCVWDEIGNVKNNLIQIYISGDNKLWIASSENGK